jgi:TonB family protein
LELRSFDHRQDSFDRNRQPNFSRSRQGNDVAQMRAALAAQSQHGNAQRRTQVAIAALVAMVATVIIMGVASWRGGRVRELLAQTQQMTEKWVHSQSDDHAASGGAPAESQRHVAKRAANRSKTMSITTRVDVPAPPAKSEFVEVVDSTNRHYLVRYTVAPVVRMAADAAPSPVAWPSSTRDVNINTSFPKAPGSAGMVVLRGVVGKDGQVRDLSIVSGPPDLTAAAADAAQSWHYVPEYINGQPVERPVQIIVDFTVRLNQWWKPSITALR